MRVIAAAFFVLLFAGNAAAADPVARTEAFVTALKRVKPLPEDGSKLSPRDKKANTAAFAALDDYLDFDTLVDASVGAHKTKFSAAQLKKFSTDFAELIRLVAFASAGSFFDKAKYKLAVKEKKAGIAYVAMDAYMAEEDLDMVVTFHWKEAGSRLRLADVSIDGDSLAKDYSAQFGRIINKGGVEDLLKKAAKRLKKEREEAIINL
jgi:ABC-type transporter MlaC component